MPTKTAYSNIQFLTILGQAFALKFSYKSHEFNNSLKVNFERLQSAKLSAEKRQSPSNTTLKLEILLWRQAKKEKTSELGFAQKPPKPKNFLNAFSV